jgi:hypothetical protein
MINTDYYAGKFSYVCCTLSVGKEKKAAVALANAVMWNNDDPSAI